jgi:hypothetical protein
LGDITYLSLDCIFTVEEVPLAWLFVIVRSRKLSLSIAPVNASNV